MVDARKPVSRNLRPQLSGGTICSPLYQILLNNTGQSILHGQTSLAAQWFSLLMLYFVEFFMEVSVHDCLFFTEHFCKAKMKFCSSNIFSSLSPQVSNLCWIIADIMNSMNLASILCSEVMFNSFEIICVSFFHLKLCDHYAFNDNCNLFCSIVFGP